MSYTSRDGDKRYEIECEIEIAAKVTYVVYAQSPEDAISHIEENRNYSIMLDELDSPEEQSRSIVDIGEAVESPFQSTTDPQEPDTGAEGGQE